MIRFWVLQHVNVQNLVCKSRGTDSPQNAIRSQRINRPSIYDCPIKAPQPRPPLLSSAQVEVKHKRRSHVSRCYKQRITELVRFLPLGLALALGLDPVVDAVDEPAAHESIVLVLLVLGLSKLEAAGGAADALVVSPLEATTTLDPFGIF